MTEDNSIIEVFDNLELDFRVISNNTSVNVLDYPTDLTISMIKNHLYIELFDKSYNNRWRASGNAAILILPSTHNKDWIENFNDMQIKEFWNCLSSTSTYRKIRNDHFVNFEHFKISCKSDFPIDLNWSLPSRNNPSIFPSVQNHSNLFKYFRKRFIKNINSFDYIKRINFLSGMEVYKYHLVQKDGQINGSLITGKSVVLYFRKEIKENWIKKILNKIREV